jgi:hypothetical protein
MRKRVRNMLEYVGRVQNDETRRADRAQQVKIPSELALRPRLPPLEEELNGISRRKSRSRSTDVDDDVEMQEPTPISPRIPLPSSSQLLDELTRDLIAFQEAFQTGDFDSLSFVAPPPPELPSPIPAPQIELEVDVDVEAEAQVDSAGPAITVESVEAEGHTPEPKSAIEADRLLTIDDQSEPMDIETEAPTNSDKGSIEPRPTSTISEPEMKPEITPEAPDEIETAAKEPPVAAVTPVLVTEIVSKRAELSSVVQAPPQPDEAEVVDAPRAVVA